MAISITVGVFGAYAFARLRFRGQRASLLLFLSTYMVPPIALVIPLYLIMVSLHLLNTRLGLIIVYCTFATPFVLWIMGNYFQTIPRDLEDAARIDGCTRIGALFRVILPLAAAGAAVDDAVRVPDRLGRVPVRADLHLDQGRQDDPGGDRRVHRPLHD